MEKISSHLEAGLEYLNAYMFDGMYRYTAAEVGSDFLVTAKEVEELSRWLSNADSISDDDPDKREIVGTVYSLWCAATPTREVK